jgi:plasmid maintenance system antidote protein VapI
VGFARLRDLATAIGVRRQTLEAIRCGARRLTPSMRARLAAALRIDPVLVDTILLTGSR